MARGVCLADDLITNPQTNARISCRGSRIRHDGTHEKETRMAIRTRLSPQLTGLISAVEVAYFRTFYKVTFDQLGQMNVFFGENDTGKSNVMRALNLFFNGVVDEDNEFDLDIDLSTARAAEASSAADIRRFAYVKVWFRTPSEHKATLGESFYVKRSWSAGTLPDYRQEVALPLRSSGKQQSLTKLMAKIDFIYIPAVKGRSVYSDLLTRSYNAIASTDKFSFALQQFTDEIRNQTIELSKRLGKSLQMSSALAPPTDLTDLFASLDFETVGASGDSMSLARQRGDGVQARHIPEILSFIAERDPKRHHIWAIEEPENSLSITSAGSISKRLQEIASSKTSQIFVTTHSPVFYSISGPQTKKYFLSRQPDGNVSQLDGTKSTVRELLDFMGDEFYLPLVAEAVSDLSHKHSQLEAAVTELRASIADKSKPVLFVEGDSEAIVFSETLSALDKNYADLIEIVVLGGVSHAEKLGALTETVLRKLLGDRLGFVLLDSDKAGVSALPKAIKAADARASWVVGNGEIRWRLLEASLEAQAAFKAAGIRDFSSVGVALEDCYSAALRRAATTAGVYALGSPREFVRSQGDLFAVSTSLMNDDHKFYLLKPDAAKKTAFAKWLVEKGQAECGVLSSLAKEILDLARAETLK